MNWKFGTIWGILLTIIEWLIFLAERGGVQGGGWFSIIPVLIFIYVGYSSFKISRRLTQAMLTTMLSGLIAGLLGSLTVFLSTSAPFWGVMLLVLEGAFAMAVLAIVLGSIGGIWARMAVAARGK